MPWYPSQLPKGLSAPSWPLFLSILPLPFQCIIADFGNLCPAHFYYVRHRLCAEAALLCFDESSFPPSPITVSQTGTVSFIFRAPLKIKRGIRYLICPRQRSNPCPSCPCCFWIVLIACWNILRFTETNGLNPKA